ncbi:DUF4383 domain-containing protein [Methylocystis bryophila]|uniref:DUF4383 domain-containing protein n=1 Tax=Methylocystis bryophila TaxID=655015 RepID=A0A1W6MUE4_9HYPH|nr:DUF4383 domain-containing protein [Methylocystis bryophila]ARN81224.1 hypothetical protein B1812_09165 [Methylocystis bryophila]
MIESRWNADLLAQFFGLLFLLLGALGFTPNAFVSVDGFFTVNDLQNYAHLATGALFLASALLGAPITTLRGVALLYAISAVVGFAFPDADMIKGFELSLADRWLHAGLAFVLLLVGFLAPIEERLSSAQT